MLALKPEQGERGARAFSRFVLPRWLRRPVRALARLADGEHEPPRFAATIATAAILAAAGIYGAFAGGHMPSLVQGVTARTGFAVSEVRIIGNRELSEIDLVASLELDGFTSLIGFNAREARRRVASLPWVETATVRKIYPRAIEVEIEERTPFAIWQHGSELTLIERDGSPIAPLSSARHAALPLVVGPGAPQNAAEFIARVARRPDLAAQVTGYVRVGDRRWDLRLANGMTVRLPEGGEERGLAELAELDREHDILSRDIVALDLRFPDRIAVQLSPEAAASRETEMKKLISARPGRRI